MSYCKEKNVGWLAWSWKGNGGGVEYLDLSNDWAGNSLSAWGKTVVSGTNGLKETSKICSVFTGSNPTSQVTQDPVVTPNPTLPANYIVGDVDGNGSFNSIDFGFLRQYLLGIINKFPGTNGALAADVNKDRSINSLDFAAMRQVLLGIKSSF